MKRVILVVLDSVGCGALPDADKYGDAGANTLGHIMEQEHPSLPNMERMGLGLIPGVGCAVPETVVGAYGRAMEVSAGKDTVTGHWEISGLRVDSPFITFPAGFPSEVIDAMNEVAGAPTLGNYASSGTVILDELGEEHMRTGRPIVYTSADSVMQIAAHEDIVPLEKLYEMCRIARSGLRDQYAVGRVIARPFKGTGKGHFERTPHRRDYSIDPIGRTVLDVLKDNGLFTMGIGKIEDIFNRKGLCDSDHASGNPACIDAMLTAMKRAFDGLLFVNLVDFDAVYGHRRNVKGYAEALKAFDDRLPEIMGLMGEDDVLILTADHGCDPTHTGTDHTREYIPILAWSPRMTHGTDLGTRATYADIAATIADLFGAEERFGAASFAQLL